MIKIKTNGILSHLQITQQPMPEYAWDAFEDITKRFAYCIIHCANIEKDFINMLEENKFSLDFLIGFCERLRIKLCQELGTNDLFRCIMYFGWPQNSRLPAQASQQHFFVALTGMILSYLVSEYKFNDYVHYSSFYVQEQVTEIHKYDEWEELMLTADKQMMKNIYSTLQEVCLAMYNFICEFYNISKLQQQNDQYYKLNGNFSIKMMFKPTNNSTIVAQNNDL